MDILRFPSLPICLRFCPFGLSSPHFPLCPLSFQLMPRECINSLFDNFTWTKISGSPPPVGLGRSAAWLHPNVSVFVILVLFFLMKVCDCSENFVLSSFLCICAKLRYASTCLCEIVCNTVCVFVLEGRRRLTSAFSSSSSSSLGTFVAGHSCCVLVKGTSVFVFFLFFLFKVNRAGRLPTLLAFLGFL